MFIKKNIIARTFWYKMLWLRITLGIRCWERNLGNCETSCILYYFVYLLCIFISGIPERLPQLPKRLKIPCATETTKNNKGTFNIYHNSGFNHFIFVYFIHTYTYIYPYKGVRWRPTNSLWPIVIGQ